MAFIAIREIMVPTNNKIVITVPDYFIGKKIEVLAFEIDDESQISKN